MPSAAFAALSLPRTAATRSAFADRSSGVASATISTEPRRAGNRGRDRIFWECSRIGRADSPRGRGYPPLTISPRGRGIAHAIALVDDRRRIAWSDQQQVEQQSPGATVAVEERMDPLKAGVQVRQGLHDRRADLPPFRNDWASVSQSRISIGTCGHSGGRIPPGKGPMSCSRNEPGAPSGSLADAARHPIPASSPGSGPGAPPASSAMPPYQFAGTDRVSVDPVGSIGIASDLEVFAQLLVTHRATLGEA